MRKHVLLSNQYTLDKFFVNIPQLPDTVTHWFEGQRPYIILLPIVVRHRLHQRRVEEVRATIPAAIVVVAVPSSTVPAAS